MFRVGQKVVCVDASPTRSGDRWLDGEQITVGNIYTIRDIGVSFGKLCFQLEEVSRITNSIYSKAGVWGYAARRFRPIVERKTDISIFKAMLTPAGRKREAV